MFGPLPSAAAPDLLVIAHRSKRAREAEETSCASQLSSSGVSSMQAQRCELLTQVARGYLELKEDVGQRARDENPVARVSEIHPLALGMAQSIEHYDNIGKENKPNQPGYHGHPLGKRPDAMMKALIVRVIQLVESEDKKVQLELQAQEPLARASLENAISLISEQAVKILHSSSDLRATRCFRVLCDTSEHTVEHKFIFFMSSETALMNAFRILRDAGFGHSFGFFLERDTAPRGGRSKRVHQLLTQIAGSGAKDNARRSRGGSIKQKH